MGPQRDPHERRVGFPNLDRWRAMQAQCGKGCTCVDDCNVKYAVCIVKIYQRIYGVNPIKNEVS